jgi:hypothetical protein
MFGLYVGDWYSIFQSRGSVLSHSGDINHFDMAVLKHDSWNSCTFIYAIQSLCLQLSKQIYTYSL